MTTTAARPKTSPGCVAGPQGFHIYDLGDVGRRPTLACAYCPKEASEVEILSELCTYEPPPGSVVLAEGIRGRSWQRRWNEPQSWMMGNRTSTWHTLLERSRPGSRVWLLYVPEEEA